MSGQGVPPPKNDPLPEIIFSKGSLSRKKNEEVGQIEYAYDRARQAKGSNRQMWLAQVLDRGMEFCSKRKALAQTAQPIKDACGYALAAIGAAGDSNSKDPNGQRALGPDYKTEAVLYASPRVVNSGFSLAHAHANAASYHQARNAIEGQNTDSARLNKIGGISQNPVAAAKKTDELAKKLRGVNLWKDGITQQPAVAARAVFQKDYVLYLRKQLRKKFEVRFADRDGTVARANASKPDSDLPLNDGQHMFAMRTKVVNNQERVSFCAADEMLGASPKEQKKFAEKLGLVKGQDFDNMFFNHSSFFKGKPVTCAGVLEIRDKRIVDINTNTGHYKSTGEDLHKAVKYIHEQQGGLPENMTATEIRVVDVKGERDEGARPLVSQGIP